MMDWTTATANDCRNWCDKNNASMICGTPILIGRHNSLAEIELRDGIWPTMVRAIHPNQLTAMQLACKAAEAIIPDMPKKEPEPVQHWTTATRVNQ